MTDGAGIFSEIKRCDACEDYYSAHDDACSCGNVDGVLMPASLFRPEMATVTAPITVEPAQPPLVIPEPQRKHWGKRGR